MEDTVLGFEDWRDFFSKTLVDSGAFVFFNSQVRGDQDIEIYKSITGDLHTTIEVSYFSSMTLLYVYILHPDTPGNNQRQRAEYLYKYEFHPEKDYGGPGLDFESINVSGIDNLLKQGLHGTEKTFYNKGKLIHSELITSYFPDSPRFTRKYIFDKRSFWLRLISFITGSKNKYDEVKVVNLRDVFKGVSQQI